MLRVQGAKSYENKGFCTSEVQNPKTGSDLAETGSEKSLQQQPTTDILEDTFNDGIILRPVPDFGEVKQLNN